LNVQKYGADDGIVIALTILLILPTEVKQKHTNLIINLTTSGEPKVLSQGGKCT